MPSSASSGRRERETPGAGAAGGVGYALLAIQGRFRSFALQPGIELLTDATDFGAHLADSDLVVTGEGRIDAQTAFGKTAMGVARRAQAAGVACIAVGGGVEPEGIDALATAWRRSPSRSPSTLDPVGGRNGVEGSAIRWSGAGSAWRGLLSIGVDFDRAARRRARRLTPGPPPRGQEAEAASQEAPVL